jgi:Ca-activated chloride channel family protein
MKSKLFTLVSLLVILSLGITSCGVLEVFNLRTVNISIIYGSEKEEWLEPLVMQFNEEKHKTEEGSVIVVEATPMGSIESVDGIIEGALQPTVWSPASSVYIPVANAEWRRIHADDLAVGTPKDLVLSPVVIAMWEPMARALGWPQKQLGWVDIANLAVSENGWSEYGYPEWGKFKFGHTHPEYSNSGIVSIIAEAYAGADKQRGLTVDDLNDPEVRAFMADVEKSIIHYGTSTGFFGTRMFERGPSYLSAAVLYENLIVAQETRRLGGDSPQLPVVAIYPKEGTFWSNHPYVIVNAPWVTDEQRAAAELFEAFLLDRPQQLKAIELGFRPADPSIPLTAPLDGQHGVDTSQPKTVLEVPSAEVVATILETWKQTKKPVDLMIVMDVSGSMRGEKIVTARASLLQFLELLDDRDRVEVILFSSEIIPLAELSPMSVERDELMTRVSGIVEGGDTRLYDAVSFAYDELTAQGDADHIRSIVVLSDGQDTHSLISQQQLLNEINRYSDEGGSSIKLFTIGFGENADKDVLRSIAEPTGGKQYDATPENIHKIYQEISTFF